MCKEITILAAALASFYSVRARMLQILQSIWLFRKLRKSWSLEWYHQNHWFVEMRDWGFNAHVFLIAHLSVFWSTVAYRYPKVWHSCSLSRKNNSGKLDSVSWINWETTPSDSKVVIRRVFQSGIRHYLLHCTFLIQQKELAQKSNLLENWTLLCLC